MSESRLDNMEVQDVEETVTKGWALGQQEEGRQRWMEAELQGLHHRRKRGNLGAFTHGPGWGFCCPLLPDPVAPAYVGSPVFCAASHFLDFV